MNTQQNDFTPVEEGLGVSNLLLCTAYDTRRTFFTEMRRRSDYIAIARDKGILHSQNKCCTTKQKPFIRWLTEDMKLISVSGAHVLSFIFARGSHRVHTW